MITHPPQPGPVERRPEGELPSAEEAAPVKVLRAAARLRRAAPVVVLSLALLAWSVLVTHFVRGMWFYGDDFDFLLRRSVSFHGDRNLLVPHNEHWSTIPILLYRLDFALFGMRHYLPYGIMPVALHVAICILLYWLLRRSGVRPWASLLTTLVVVFLGGGAGGENVLWDFQVGFLGSCFLGLGALALFVAGRRGRGVQIAAVTLLVLSLMCSGMGLVMTAWAAAYLFVRDGLRAALFAAAAPMVVFLVWYASYGRGHHGAPPGDVFKAPAAALRGLGNIWTDASGMPQAGPVILAMLVVAVIAIRRRDPLFALAASGMIAVGAGFALFGYTRNGMGPGATTVSRYVYFGVVLTAPAVASAIELVGARLATHPRRVLVSAWLIAALVTTAVGSAETVNLARAMRNNAAGVAPRIVAAEQLVSSGQRLLRTLPSPDLNGDITVQALRRPEVRRALPDVQPDLSARLDVAQNLQVDVGPTGHGLPPAVQPRLHHFGPPLSRPRAAVDGCTTRPALAGAFIEVQPVQGGSELRLTVSGNAFDTELARGAGESAVRHWPAVPGESQWVSTTAQDATLRVYVPPGRVVLCTR